MTASVENNGPDAQDGLLLEEDTDGSSFLQLEGAGTTYLILES